MRQWDVVAAWAVLLVCNTVSYGQPEGLELGVIMGEPTGVSAKYWLTGASAVDAAAAWSLADRDYLHFHADYLLHNFAFFSVPAGEMPVYVGGGGLLRIGAGDPGIAVRVPVGASYLLNRFPLDMFIELVPVLDILPVVDVDLEGGLGIRFVFGAMSGQG